MALKSMTKLVVGLFFILGASTAIGSDATCKNGQGGDCEDDTPKQADTHALFQSKTVQVLTARVPSEDDPNTVLAETDKGGEIEELDVRLDEAKATVQKLNDEITEANQKVSKITGFKKEATDVRTTGKQEDAGAIKDAAASQKASIRPRMKKLMEMDTTVNDIIAMGKAAVTPEFKTVIGDLIAVVEDLQDKVKRDQNFAQTEVDERIAGLTETTERAVEEKTHADEFDTSLDQCISEEQRLLQAYETCKTEEGVLEIEKPSAEYCGHPDFGIEYTDPPQLPFTLTVDFSQGLANVQRELDHYLAPLEQWIDVKKTTAASDQVKWDTADQKCKNKTKELADKTTECGESLEAWRAQHEKCLHADTAQEKSLCEFGHAYQAKCTGKTAFDTLKTDITGNGTSYSEPDRKQEWRHTVRLGCVLNQIKSTTELTTGAVETCTTSNDRAAQDFETDVGSIDLKQTAYELLTSSAKFTCEEASIMFGSGVLWTVPFAGEVPKSTDYTKATGYQYAIESDPSNGPFDFC